MTATDLPAARSHRGDRTGRSFVVELQAVTGRAVTTSVPDTCPTLTPAKSRRGDRGGEGSGLQDRCHQGRVGGCRGADRHPKPRGLIHLKAFKRAFGARTLTPEPAAPGA